MHPNYHVIARRDCTWNLFLQVKRQQESVTDVDDGVETYNYNNANDVENFCPCPEVNIAFYMPW